MKIHCYTDGASKNNPGPAGAGALATNEKGEVLFEISEFLGNQTNNFAEYTALILALKKLKEMNLQSAEVICLSDSKLLVEQLTGNWKVKHANIKPLFAEAKKLLEEFSNVEFKHVPREQNKRADALANEAISQ